MKSPCLRQRRGRAACRKPLGEKRDAIPSAGKKRARAATLYLARVGFGRTLESVFGGKLDPFGLPEGRVAQVAPPATLRIGWHKLLWGFSRRKLRRRNYGTPKSPSGALPRLSMQYCGLHFFAQPVQTVRDSNDSAFAFWAPLRAPLKKLLKCPAAPNEAKNFAESISGLAGALQWGKNAAPRNKTDDFSGIGNCARARAGGRARAYAQVGTSVSSVSRSPKGCVFGK